jgi:hypothetical protein
MRFALLAYVIWNRRRRTTPIIPPAISRPNPPVHTAGGRGMEVAAVPMVMSKSREAPSSELYGSSGLEPDEPAKASPRKVCRPGASVSCVEKSGGSSGSLVLASALLSRLRADDKPDKLPLMLNGSLWSMTSKTKLNVASAPALAGQLKSW